jgi:hypothetical protein
LVPTHDWVVATSGSDTMSDLRTPGTLFIGGLLIGPTMLLMSQAQ